MDGMHANQKKFFYYDHYDRKYDHVNKLTFGHSLPRYQMIENNTLTTKIDNKNIIYVS